MTREAVRIIQVPRLLLQFDRTCTYVSCTIGSLIPNLLCLAISMCMHLGKVLLNAMFYPDMKVNNWKTYVLNILQYVAKFNGLRIQVHVLNSKPIHLRLWRHGLHLRFLEILK
jgi:hypothetical protein